MVRPPRDASALRAGCVRQTMNPTRNPKKKLRDLCKIVRSQRSLERAWHHVEKRAASSKDQDTQKALARFRENPAKELRRISRHLNNGSYVFEPQRGYAKPRKGKSSRPIVVAPLSNRIVQRSVLDVCQSSDALVRAALGNLPRVIDCPTSVGGLPGRGVPEAIEGIRAAINLGAKWYVRSDLRNFFTKIPKPKIEEFLRSNVTDADFVQFFMKALSTELSNEDALRAELDLFPTGDNGVPQGSALSALCANIILEEFDHALNGRGVTTFRYLDDFVILASSRKAVEKAWSNALRILSGLGLEAHDPEVRTGKASKGQIIEGFEFLSFRIDQQAVLPSADARSKLLDGTRAVIRTAKKEIQKAGMEPRRAEPMYLQTLVLLDKKIRGWGDAFSSTTNRVLFSQMDDELDKIIDDFTGWFGWHFDKSERRARRRKMGIALLGDT